MPLGLQKTLVMGYRKSLRFILQNRKTTGEFIRVGCTLEFASDPAHRQHKKGEFNLPDVRLIQNTLFPGQGVVQIDWNLLGNGTLDDTQSLATAVIVALGTDRLAEPGDVLPDPDDTNRRGWWGDAGAEEIWNGWPIGTRLWLMRREKIVPLGPQGPTVVRIENYIREAIQPFLDQRIGSSMEVIVTRVDMQRIDALVRIYRGPVLEIDLRYQILWTGIVEESGFADIGTPLQG
jgi:phage gp46-like protein